MGRKEGYTGLDPQGERLYSTFGILQNLSKPQAAGIYGDFPSCILKSKYGCRTGPQRKQFPLGLKHSNIAIAIASLARYEEKSNQRVFYVPES